MSTVIAQFNFHDLRLTTLHNYVRNWSQEFGIGKGLFFSSLSEDAELHSSLVCIDSIR